MPARSKASLLKEIEGTLHKVPKKGLKDLLEVLRLRKENTAIDTMLSALGSIKAEHGQQVERNAVIARDNERLMAENLEKRVATSFVVHGKR